jgi:hypothetical protein
MSPLVCRLVLRSRLDGIAWLIVSLSMVTQAVFIGRVAWWPEAALATGMVPVPVASLFVASAFALSAMGALYLGVRGLSAAKRAR